MKRRKLKRFVLPTICLSLTIALLTGVLYFTKENIIGAEYKFSTELIDDEVEPVIEETEEANNEEGIIISPVDNNSVTIGTYYYNKDDDASRQEQSLILYEDTYLPNSGLLYTSTNSFEIKNVFDGKVLDVKDDEILGAYVIVEHNSNLKTYYYGLENISVEKDEQILKGTLIGNSKENNISKGTKSFLFEVYYKGETINPEKLINANIENYE